MNEDDDGQNFTNHHREAKPPGFANDEGPNPELSVQGDFEASEPPDDGTSHELVEKLVQGGLTQQSSGATDVDDFNENIDVGEEPDDASQSEADNDLAEEEPGDGDLLEDDPYIAYPDPDINDLPEEWQGGFGDEVQLEEAPNDEAPGDDEGQGDKHQVHTKDADGYDAQFEEIDSGEEVHCAEGAVSPHITDADSTSAKRSRSDHEEGGYQDTSQDVKRVRST